MKFFALIWSNLKRKKLRTLLTLLSILVGFLLFGFLCALKQAFTGGVSMAGADRLVVRHKVSIIQLLPLSYENQIRQIPGVTDVACLTWFGGIYQDPKNFFASMPVEPESFMKVYPEFVLPEAQRKAWLQTRTGAIVGKRTAQRLGWKLGDRIPLTSPIWPRDAKNNTWEFDLVGIFDGAKKTTDTSQFFFRYDYFDEGRTYGKGEVGWYVIRIRNPDQAPAIARQIDELFANSPEETKTEPEGAFAKAFAQQIGDIGKILVGVLSAVFFTILLVAGNTMAQAVRERTEELGVLKAMGFTNGMMLSLVLAESVLLAGLGGLAGLAAAWLIISSGNPAASILPLFYLPTEDLLIGVGLALGLGIFAGLLPALQAMRLRIAEALRRNA